MCMPHATLQSRPSLSPSQIADLRLAACRREHGLLPIGPLLCQKLAEVSDLRQSRRLEKGGTAQSG
jgi:hypothetical protein